MRILKDHIRRKRQSRSPQWTLVNAFLAVILAGTLLLCHPVSSASGKSINPFDALFTATSATCVTGLSVVDIGSLYSLFGQIVILALIQVGGIGIMTFGTFMLILLGKRMSVRSESVLSTAFGEGKSISILSLLRNTVFFSVIIEGIGAIVLAWRHWEAGFSPLRAAYFGIFHSISAFCNAGFSLFPDNLIAVHQDPVYILTVALLIVSGGVGFLVLHNLSHYKFWERNRLKCGRVSAHSRMVLQTSLALIIIGALLYGAQEWEHALASRSTSEKCLGALFQSVSTRTAGFNVVAMTEQTEPSRFLTMALMFIGGSPGSTAGGIKTTTLLVLILTIISMIRSRNATLYGVRAIPDTIVREAIAIFLLGSFFVAGIFGLLLLTEMPPTGGCAAFPLLFETISAFGTVGLSLDLTPQLSALGRLLIIVAMFVGRLGPLTIVLIVGSSGRSDHIHYPEEEVVVG